MVFASWFVSSRRSRNLARGARHLEVADGVESRVRAEGAAHARVGVAQRTQVELLGPAPRVVEQRQFVEQRRLQPERVGGGERAARAKRAEGRVELGGGRRLDPERFQPVVGGAAAHRVERVVAGLQRVEQRRQRATDGPARRLLQLRDVRVEGGRVVDGEDPIGPPGRIDPGRGVATLREAGMVPQVVGRIVGGADDGHAEPAQQAQGREAVLLQPRVAPVEDGARGGRRQQVVHAERPPQLHVRPVVQRVAHRVGHRARPRLELLPGRCVSRAVPLVHAVGPHRAPLVVIAVEPDLGDRGEAVIARHLLRREVAVIVDDGEAGSDAMVEVDRHRALEQEILRQEPRHASAPSSSACVRYARSRCSRMARLARSASRARNAT